MESVRGGFRVDRRRCFAWEFDKIPLTRKILQNPNYWCVNRHVRDANESDEPRRSLQQRRARARAAQNHSRLYQALGKREDPVCMPEIRPRLFTLDPILQEREGVRHLNMVDFMASEGDLLKG